MIMELKSSPLKWTRIWRDLGRPGDIPVPFLPVPLYGSFYCDDEALGTREEECLMVFTPGGTKARCMCILNSHHMECRSLTTSETKRFRSLGLVIDPTWVDDDDQDFYSMGPDDEEYDMA